MLKIQGQPKVWMGDKITAKVGVAVAAGALDITAISKASPAVITDVAHGMTSGDVATIDAGDMVELTSGEYEVTVVSVDTFSVVIDSTAFTTYTTGGTWTLLETDEATVTLSMDGQSVAVDDLNSVDYNDIAVGDWCVSPVTVLAVTGAGDWEIISAANFTKFLVANGG